MSQRFAYWINDTASLWMSNMTDMF